MPYLAIYTWSSTVTSTSKINIILNWWLLGAWFIALNGLGLLATIGAEIIEWVGDQQKQNKNYLESLLDRCFDLERLLVSDLCRPEHKNKILMVSAKINVTRMITTIKAQYIICTNWLFTQCRTEGRLIDIVLLCISNIENVFYNLSQVTFYKKY